MIDLTKLTPAPWRVTTPEQEGLSQHGSADGVRIYGSVDSQWVADVGVGLNDPERVANAVFIAMACNAFAGDPESLAWWEANRVRIGVDAVAEEREACAKAIEAEADRLFHRSGQLPAGIGMHRMIDISDGVRSCAAIIRARSNIEANGDKK